MLKDWEKRFTEEIYGKEMSSFNPLKAHKFIRTLANELLDEIKMAGLNLPWNGQVQKKLEKIKELRQLFK